MNHTPSIQLSRVQQAHDEVGVTEIRPAAAAWFAGIWLLLIASVLFIDHLVEWRQQAGEESVSFKSLAVVEGFPAIFKEAGKDPFTFSNWIEANRSLLERIKLTEEDIDESGAVASWMRPWAQRGLLSLGVGNEKVYPGRHSWLFYRPDVDSVTGPGFLDSYQLQARAEGVEEWEDRLTPNPLPAIIDFHQQLAERGIELIVVPVPVKAEIAPGNFSSRFVNNQTVRNPSFEAFLDQLRGAGVWVADVAQWMSEYERDQQKPSFLQSDTHWTPSSMQWVARRLSDELKKRSVFEERDTPLTMREPMTISNRGDIAAMLDLPPGMNPFSDESVVVESILQQDGQLWQSSNDAELLVLGDSFSNIYSLNGMGWGESAGFVEHLGHYLQRPVDRIVRNDQGAFATRKVLATELARGRDRLAGKKVVIYQFATRELAFGDWQRISLQLVDVVPSTFLTVDSGRALPIEGTVQEISPVPRPGSVPYKDHIVSLHLVDVEMKGTGRDRDQAVVFMRSMRDNVWTRAARVRPGDKVKLTVSNWSDVADELDGLNRSELDDLELQLQEPLWGQWQEK